jgi:RecA-family ATPase
MLLGGPTAAGKTAVGVAMALAFGSGRPILGQKIFLGPQGVLHISSEESTEELKRRYVAAAMHHQIKDEHRSNITVRGNDAMGGKPIELMRATAKGGSELNPGGMGIIEQLIEISEARVVLLDPLYSFLSTGLNDNEPMGQLLLRLRTLAQQKNIVIIVMHHPAKGRDPESNESYMGASSIVFAVRSALGIIRATDTEVQKIDGANPSMGCSGSLTARRATKSQPTRNNGICSTQLILGMAREIGRMETM